MGGCSFRSKQMTGVVIVSPQLRGQRKNNRSKQKRAQSEASKVGTLDAIGSKPNPEDNQNISSLQVHQDDQQLLHVNLNDLSPAKRSLLESRKLEVDYTIIPNKVRHRAMIPEEEASGLIGLTNLGNTCFLNSALQCLLNTPQIADYFMNDLHMKEINITNPLGSKGAVTLSFAHLTKQYWSREDIDEINPKELYGVISHFAPQFSHGTQEDSHEFIAFLLDIIHEDLNRVKVKPTIEDKDYNDDKLEEHASEAWKHYLMRNKSIIVDLFQGQSKSTLKCLKCGLVSHKFEPFMYLSLPIPEQTKKKQKVTLVECMEEFSKEEKLEGDERWNCPKCKTLVDSTKKMEIWKLPNLLIVHLKRFKFTREKRAKIRTLIDFPHVDLDLTKVAAGQQRDKPIYDLYAVSNHEGNLGGGHYYTFAKNRDDANWYAYNDSEVLTLSPDQLVSPAAYLLFFSKSSVDDFKRQTLSRPDAWPHLFRKSTQHGLTVSNSYINDDDERFSLADSTKSRQTPGRNRDKFNLHKPLQVSQITKQNISIFNINISPEDNLVAKMNKQQMNSYLPGSTFDVNDEIFKESFSNRNSRKQPLRVIPQEPISREQPSEDTPKLAKRLKPASFQERKSSRPDVKPESGIIGSERQQQSQFRVPEPFRVKNDLKIEDSLNFSRDRKGFLPDIRASSRLKQFNPSNFEYQAKYSEENEKQPMSELKILRRNQ